MNSIPRMRALDSERFTPPGAERELEILDYADDDGLLTAQADCRFGCKTKASPAAVRAGVLPCPRGHASVAWSRGAA